LSGMSVHMIDTIMRQAPNVKSVSSCGLFYEWALSSDPQADLSKITFFAFDESEDFDMENLNSLFRMMPNLTKLTYYCGDVGPDEDKLDWQCLPSLEYYDGFELPQSVKIETSQVKNVHIKHPAAWNVLDFPKLQHLSIISIFEPVDHEFYKAAVGLFKQGKLITLQIQFDNGHYSDEIWTGGSMIRFTIQRDRCEIFGNNENDATQGFLDEIQKVLLDISNISPKTEFYFVERSEFDGILDILQRSGAFNNNFFPKMNFDRVKQCTIPWKERVVV